jgi:hypothetical protein
MKDGNLIDNRCYHPQRCIAYITIDEKKIVKEKVIEEVSTYRW